MAESHVPPSGNWEGGENEKAGKDQTAEGVIADPVHPEENPDTNATDLHSSGGRVELEEPTGEEAVKQAYNGQTSLEDGEVKRFAKFPLQGSQSAPQRSGARGASPGETPKHVLRQSGGSEHNIEKSPLHPHARILGRGSTGASSSPAREGKAWYDNIHGTPGRSRLRPKSEDSPDKGAAAVPKFGDWDENNPAAADGYSYIFNKVREERQNGVAIGAPSEPSYGNASRQSSDSSKNCCGCFPWK